MARGLDRINHFLEGTRRNSRKIATPEGVPLEVHVANHGERLAAFALDMFFWLLATVLLYLGLVLITVERVRGHVVVTILLFLAFLLRNLYFIHFELSTQGSTPGKRIIGLRVIDRKGGPLLPDAIVARNLTREVEVFLPLTLYIQLLATPAGTNSWMVAFYLGWVGLVSALPLFNRDHMRAGDLIAGTMVISIPRRVLLSDLVTAASSYVFTRKQLDTYGVFEVQVLEELLRRPDAAETRKLRQEVCGKICRKIDWKDEIPPDEILAFLTAFYTAERGHLEREQLFGNFRADSSSAVVRNVDGSGGTNRT